MSIVPLGTQVAYEFFPLLSAARNLSSFQLLPTSLMTDLLQLFLGLPLFLLPSVFHSRAGFGISPSSFLSVWPIHLSFLFLISKFISSWPATLHKSLLQMTFGHHILKMYLRHLLTKVCILRLISLVTSHVSHDFTQALKILILVSFRISVDSHTFLSLQNDPLLNSHTVDEIMWKNIVERDRPQIIWRMRITCWIPKTTNTHSK